MDFVDRHTRQRVPVSIPEGDWDYTKAFVKRNEVVSLGDSHFQGLKVTSSSVCKHDSQVLVTKFMSVNPSSPILLSSKELSSYQQIESLKEQKINVWKEGGICGVISYVFSVIVWGFLSAMDLNTDGFNPTWQTTHTRHEVAEDYITSKGTRKISDEMALSFARRIAPEGVKGMSLQKLAERIQASNAYSRKFEGQTHRMDPQFRILQVYKDGVLDKVQIRAYTKETRGQRSAFFKIGPFKRPKYYSSYEMQAQMKRRGEVGGVAFYAGNQDYRLPRKISKTATEHYPSKMKAQFKRRGYVGGVAFYAGNQDYRLPREISRAATEGLKGTDITAERLEEVVKNLNAKGLFKDGVGKIHTVFVRGSQEQAGVAIYLGKSTSVSIAAYEDAIHNLNSHVFPALDVRLKVDVSEEGGVVFNILDEKRAKELVSNMDPTAQVSQGDVKGVLSGTDSHAGIGAVNCRANGKDVLRDMQNAGLRTSYAQ